MLGKSILAKLSDSLWLEVSFTYPLIEDKMCPLTRMLVQRNETFCDTQA